MGGLQVSKNQYGCAFSLPTSDPVVRKETAYKPFEVRYVTKDGEGEWQIYLPPEAATINQNGKVRPYRVDMDKAKDENGDDLYAWYVIDKNSMKDANAEIQSNRVYQVKAYPVHVLLKPYPAMAVTCNPDEYGRAQWSRIVAYIGKIKITGIEKERGVVTQVFSGSIEETREERGKFAILYEPDKNSGGEYRAFLRNANVMVGRLMVSAEDTDVTDWEEVWVRIQHDDEGVNLEVLPNNEKDEKSDADKTIALIYKLEDGVVVEDCRENISNDFGFYTLLDESNAVVPGE
jgi:hypothetical protein